MKGVAPLREVAAAMGVTVRCAKRRMLKLHKKLGGGLLVQFTEGGHHFADVAMLKKYLPGVLVNDDEDPGVLALRGIAEVKDMVRYVQDDTSAIRAAVGA